MNLIGSIVLGVPSIAAMIEATTAVAGISTWSWVIALGAVAIGLAVLMRAPLPRFPVRLCVALGLSLMAGWALVSRTSVAGGVAQQVAMVCSVLSFMWVCVAAAERFRVEQRSSGSSAETEILSVARSSGLFLGTITAAIMTVILVIRAIYVVVDVVHGYPYRSERGFGFGVQGLWILGLLLMSSVVSAIQTRDRRVGTVVFWSALLLASWASLLPDPFRSTSAGGIERTGATLLPLMSWSVILALTVLATGLVDRRSKSLVSGETGVSDCSADPVWPGLSVSYAAIGLAVFLTSCYHLAVPVRVSIGGFRMAVFLVAGFAGIASWACFSILARCWHRALADAAIGLISISICGVATLAVPSRTTDLAQRYPMIFNAMIVGFTVSMGLCTWFASDFQRRIATWSNVKLLERLVPHARRFAFLNAAFALMLGAAMAIWPRWPEVATMDDAPGRVTAGFAANLFLLLVMLWCSRRLHRMTFQILTVLSVLSGAGFLVVRMLAFVSRSG